MRQAVFRFDASAKIGAGHAYRCLTLADALTQKGWTCYFAVREESERFIGHLWAGQHQVIRLKGPVENEIDTICGTLHEKISLIVIDHYQRFVSYERQARDVAHVVMVINDLPNRKYDCDILLDQTFKRQEDAYRPLVSDKCQLLLGAEYALIRESFKEKREEALKRRGVIQKVNRILINLGMSENSETLYKIIKGVCQSNLDAEIRLIMSHNTVNADRIIREFEIHNMRYKVLHYVKDMATEMTLADLAIGGVGVSSWERCCLGLPAIVTVLADNQADICAALSSAGAIHNLGVASLISTDDMEITCRKITQDLSTYASMSSSAANICDGRGSDRCIQAIENLISPL